VWAVALSHCCTVAPLAPLNRRMCAHFPPSQPALLICAHISWPRHLAKAGPFCAHFRPSAASVRKVRTFFGCRGEIYSIPQNVRTNQESRLRGREMCAHSPWCSGATVQQCDGARPENGAGGPSSALQVGAAAQLGLKSDLARPPSPPKSDFDAVKVGLGAVGGPTLRPPRPRLRSDLKVHA